MEKHIIKNPQKYSIFSNNGIQYGMKQSFPSFLFFLSIVGIVGIVGILTTCFLDDVINCKLV